MSAIVAPRALTDRERAALIAMIRHGRADAAHRVTPADRDRWEGHAPGASVSGACTCGECPTVELLDPRGPAPEDPGSRIVLEAEAPGALLLLFIDDDRLSCLEAAPLDAPVMRFPSVEAIRFG